MNYLVATNVISELRKGPRCDAFVAAWWSVTSEENISLSVLTIGEIRKGIESLRRRDVAAASALESRLARIMRDHADRILPIDGEIAEEWGRLNVPDPLPVVDSLLAATAKVRGLTFATRNVVDIARTGIDLLNPWREG